jgi:septal ring factor EnvC (AmiA/AmiB activator)
MSDTLTYTTTLAKTHCGACGVPFAMPSNLLTNARENSKIWFWCPNGHQLHCSEDECDRLRTKNAQLERQLANRDEDVRAAKAALTATKGELTKVRKRIENGVCPHCHRSFQNVKRHMATQHKEPV